MADNSLGVKYDSDKPDWSLLPFSALGEVVKVLTFGAKKYKRDNWIYDDDAESRYFAAAMRHLSAWKCGERKDPETGLSHLAHATCCILFLIFVESNGRTKTSTASSGESRNV